MEAESNISFNYHTYFSQFNSLSELPVVREAINCSQAVNEKIQQSVYEAFQRLHEKLKQVPIDALIDKTIEYGTNLERGLNIAAIIPFLGPMTSAVIRIPMGKIQFLTGAIFASLTEALHFIGSKFNADKELLKTLRKLSTLGLEFMIHGALNVIRGAGELLIGTCTFGLGSIGLIVPNIVHQRNFAPYFTYGSLLEERQMHEINILQTDVPHASSIPPAGPQKPACLELIIVPD